MINIAVTITLVLVLLLPGLTANSLALYCVLCDVKRQKTLAKELLLLLTCVDLIASFSIPFLHIIVPTIDNPSFFICMLTGLSQTFFSLFATGIGVLMACERFVALKLPYWYYITMFQKKIRIPIILMTLYIAIICMLPPVGVGSVQKIMVKNGSEVITCGVFPKESPKTTRERIFPTLYAGSGCLFTLTSVFLNMSVIKLLYSMRHKISPPEIVRIEKEMKIKSRKLSQEFVMTKMVILLSISFVICLTPLYIELLLQQTGIEIPNYLSHFTHALNAISSITDPIINIAIRQKYCNQIKAIVCCKRTSTNAIIDRTGSAIRISIVNKDVGPEPTFFLKEHSVIHVK